MKIFQLFSKLNSSGLSTGKTVGLLAALGAAGMGAFSLLSSDEQDANTAFNNPYNQPEVVYVSHAAGGNYQGGVSGKGTRGENSSFLAVRSKAIEMQQRQAARQGAGNGDDIYTAPEDLGAYKFGSSEGFGGNTTAKEDFLAAGGMSRVDAAAGKAGSIQNAIAQAQAQARLQGGAAGGGKTLVTGGLNSRAVTRAGGNALNAGWEQAGTAALPGNSVNVGGVPSVRGESTTLRARNISDGARFSRDINATVGRARRGLNGNNLEDMTKMSAAIAGNKNNKANEGGKIFFANGEYSGGISVGDGDKVGSYSASSSSFNTSNSINALHGALGDIEKVELDFKEERSALRKSFWGMAAMVVLKALAVFTLLCSLLGAVFGVRLAKKWRKKIDQWIVEKANAYDQRWGDRSTTGQQLAFSAKNFLKPAIWMGPFATVYVFAVMPWSLMKQYNTHGIEQNDQDIQVNTTPGGSAGYSASGGDSLNLHSGGGN